MKFTILEKNPTTLLSKELTVTCPETGQRPAVGSENTAKSPDVVRNWIPMLTMVMAFLVLVACAAVLHGANHIAEEVGGAMISVANIFTTCYPAVGFAGLQLLAGFFHCIHPGHSELIKSGYKCWIVVYLILMAMSIESSVFGLKIGLHRNYLGFSFVYFSIANASYLLLTVVTLLIMYRS